MTIDATPETVRPPVFLGCFFAAAALVIVILGAVFFIKFLESGANSGQVTLDVPDAYAPGNVEYNGQHNFYLVRLRDGSFLALSDLDAANRANQARRCRVQITDLNGALTVPKETLTARMSDAARGSSVVLRETCNGAIYDLAGARLDADGPNLDRYPVSVSKAGHLLVDTSTRTCSQRTAGDAFSPATCK